jgi:hypothetical protein
VRAEEPASLSLRLNRNTATVWISQGCSAAPGILDDFLAHFRRGFQRVRYAQTSRDAGETHLWLRTTARLNTGQALDLHGQCSWIPGSRTKSAPRNDCTPAFFRTLLVAPFAFLGPAYDQQLGAVYTGVGPQDVYEERGLLSAVFNGSLVDTAPLFLLISRYANGDMLTAIAEE